MKRLLIANRGEIAVRIARAAHEAGIAALGVYSEADRGAFFLGFTDEAVCIGPASPAESYLSIERILEAARALRADAIHPGYGFLSERAAFAQATIDAGLIFVGPTPAAIAAMGDKVEAKRRARASDVPVVPGYDGEYQVPARLRKEAKAIGLPLLVKAAAGGGGRGMRIVRALGEFDDALEAAQREAQAAFGDGRVLLERYLERPRHIEFQILADAHGHTLALGERECSIQRRHQKIVEEAPSVALSPELRERMAAAAVRAAQSVGYTNAGTVEFLLDENGAFYFLEMNARLQVEHPVTEAVYGIDLVRWQLRISQGEALRLTPADVSPRGWAIEARICAEDPATGYLPAAGTISAWDSPPGLGLRIDSGVARGSEVSIYYDSMLAKLIAWGPDRPAAIDRLTGALEAFDVEGVPTNVPLLLRIARDQAFRAGATTTEYLTDRGFLEARPDIEGDEPFVLAIAAVLAHPRSFRIGGIRIPIALSTPTRCVQIIASRSPGDDNARWELRGDLNGTFGFETGNGGIAVRYGERRYRGTATVGATGVETSFDGRRTKLAFAGPPLLGRSTAGRGAGGGGLITAPMPGTIAKILVAPGDTVADRDLLAILEAMKMEHRIEATIAGTVSAVHVEAGTVVKGGAPLVEIG